MIYIDTPFDMIFRYDIDLILLLLLFNLEFFTPALAGGVSLEAE